MVEINARDVDYVATQILDCSTADGIAKIAADVKKSAIYLSDDELMKCYFVLRQKVIFFAGIDEDDMPLVDAAIDGYIQTSSV